MARQHKKISEAIVNAKFRQNALLTEDQFIRYCKERDISITKETLAFLNKNGLFEPVLILRVKNGISLNYLSLQHYKNNNLLVTSKKTNALDKNVANIYHPYQIILLSVLLNRFSINFMPPYTLGNITKAANALKKLIRFNKKRIANFKKTTLVKYQKAFELLFSVEDIYLPDIRESFSGSGRKNDFDEWWEYYKKFKPKNVLRKLKMTERFAQQMYTEIDTSVFFLDPLRHWLPLIRYISLRNRKKLSGKALLAQTYYEILDIIRALTFDISDKIQLDGHYEQDSKWLEGIFKKKINYEDLDVLESILNSYGINPTPKVFVFVEGKTEIEIVNKLLEMYKSNIERVGIRLQDLGGVGGFDTRRLKNFLKYLLSKGTDCFFILDPEGRVKAQIPKLLRAFPALKDKIIIWQRDFEKDNFKGKEIAEGLSEYAKTIGLKQSFSEKEIAKSKTIRNLFCGRTNNCSEIFTCGRASNAIVKCKKNRFGKDQLNKPELGVYLTTKYLSDRALKRKRKHPAITNGIISIMNKIINHATSRTMNDRL